MRALHSLLFILLSFPAFLAVADDSVESVARLANAGAVQLALDKLERLQPLRSDAEPDKERWPAWEALRLTLLARLNRHPELLARLEKFPADASANMPADLMRQARLLGAQAALATGKPALARVYLLGLLWHAGLPEEIYRQARLLVIDSYLDGGNQREGYLAMLRYQQDFQALPPERVAKYVEALAAGGMEKEAVAWIAYLDQSHPLRLQVQLKTGLLTADAASAQARAALKKTPTTMAAAGYWAVLGQTAAMSGDFTAAIEAQEQALNLEDKNAASRTDALWKQYQAAAREVGNREHLLAGDDSAWLNLAISLPAAKAPLARALLAYLALNARAPESRRDVQSQLTLALFKQKLGRTAMSLFDDVEKFPAHSFTVEARYLLGEAALQTRQYRVAARFWKDLPVPKDKGGESADSWQLKLAGVHYRAGQPADAGKALERLLTGKNKLAALPTDIQRRSIELARSLLHDQEPVTEAVEHFLTNLLSARAFDSLQQREALLLLGKAGEMHGDFKLAADYFLQAATLIDAKAKDPVVQSARQQAATNLLKAGFKEDARGVLQK